MWTATRKSDAAGVACVGKTEADVVLHLKAQGLSPVYNPGTGCWETLTWKVEEVELAEVHSTKCIRCDGTLGTDDIVAGEIECHMCRTYG